MQYVPKNLHILHPMSCCCYDIGYTLMMRGQKCAKPRTLCICLRSHSTHQCLLHDALPLVPVVYTKMSPYGRAITHFYWGLTRRRRPTVSVSNSMKHGLFCYHTRTGMPVAGQCHRESERTGGDRQDATHTRPKRATFILGQYAVIREAVLINIHRQTREKTE